MIGMSANDADVAKLQAGYQQGGLYQYAPNVNLLHCPADQRFNPTAPGSFAYGSYSGAGGMNGFTYESAPLKKQANIVHASERYLWVEENDPRGENLGPWGMHAPTPRPSPTPVSWTRWPPGTVAPVLLVGQMVMPTITSGSTIKQSFML